MKRRFLSSSLGEDIQRRWTDQDHSLENAQVSSVLPFTLNGRGRANASVGFSDFVICFEKRRVEVSDEKRDDEEKMSVDEEEKMSFDEEEKMSVDEEECLFATDANSAESVEMVRRGKLIQIKEMYQMYWEDDDFETFVGSGSIWDLHEDENLFETFEFSSGDDLIGSDEIFWGDDLSYVAEVDHIHVYVSI